MMALECLDRIIAQVQDLPVVARRDSVTAASRHEGQNQHKNERRTTTSERDKTTKQHGKRDGGQGHRRRPLSSRGSVLGRFVATLPRLRNASYLTPSLLITAFAAARDPVLL